MVPWGWGKLVRQAVGSGLSSDLLPWPQASGGLQESRNQILKKLDEYYKQFKWD